MRFTEIPTTAAARFDTLAANYDLNRHSHLAETWVPLWPTAYDAAMWQWVARELTARVGVVASQTISQAAE